MVSFCLTDVGVKRKLNQDFVYASDEPVGQLENLYIVADGMGGHAAGDLASRCAVETMVDHIENAEEMPVLKLLGEALEEANRAVYAHAASNKELTGMGTTLVACTISGDDLYAVNIGDSRLYILDDTIEQISSDHSLVAEMVKKGQITRENARFHPDRNIITKAVGVKEKLVPDRYDVGLYPGDIVLLCSDGLTGMVGDKEILRIVRESGNLESAGRALIEAANAQGGNDNISVILINNHRGGKNYAE